MYFGSGNWIDAPTAALFFFAAIGALTTAAAGGYVIYLMVFA